MFGQHVHRGTQHLFMLIFLAQESLAPRNWDPLSVLQIYIWTLYYIFTWDSLYYTFTLGLCITYLH